MQKPGKKDLIEFYIQRVGRRNTVADAIIASAGLISALGISGMDGRDWDDETVAILLRRIARVAVDVEILGYMINPTVFVELRKSEHPAYDEGQLAEQTETPPFYPLPPMLIDAVPPLINLLALSAAGGVNTPGIAREGVPA